MVAMAMNPQDPSPWKKNQKSGTPQRTPPNPVDTRRRNMIWGIVIVALILVVLISHPFKNNNVKSISYSTFLTDAKAGNVATANIQNSSGEITGTLKDGTQYSTAGPLTPNPADLAL